MSKWVKRWKVPSESDASKTYTVAEDTEGNYGCSCPVWKFRRQECKHIARVLREMPEPGELREMDEPEIVLANVAEVTPKPRNKLYVPLIPLDDTHFQATLIYDLLHHGVSWKTCKSRYSIAKRNPMKRILAYVRTHGRRIYDNLEDPGSKDYKTVPVEPSTEERRA